MQIDRDYVSLRMRLENDISVASVTALHHCSSTPVSQPGTNVELVPIWIFERHAAQPGQVLVRGLLHAKTLSPEFLEPDVDVLYVQVNQPAHRAISGVFGQKEGHSVARHLRKDGKSRFESMFPINLKTEAIDVELLAPRVVSHPQRRHHALLGILIDGHRVTPSLLGSQRH
jgi:hypothetical protein